MEDSNIKDVIAWLQAFADGIDFTRPGKDQSLGRDVAMKVVEGIATRSAQEQRGATVTWPANSTTVTPWYPAGYAGWKDEKYGWSEVNYRTGQMLSQVSLFGRTTISAREVVMTYGTNAAPDVSKAPTGYLSRADKAVTDSAKATYATLGGRPFYELDDTITGWVMDVCTEWVSTYVSDTNRANGY